jgi:hypothetical protein
MVKEVANEPSVGLYFVQQHVHKAVPGLLALKSHVQEGTEEAILYTQDVNDALASVKVMNEVGPPVFAKMISTFNASLQLLYQPKTRPPPAYSHLSRSASYHGTAAMPSSQAGSKTSINTPEATGKSSRVSERLPPRSSSSQGNANSSATTQTDTSGFVTGLLSSAYQRASSVKLSMPAAFEVKERVIKQDNATDVSATTSTGYIPSIPYWNVLESAIQKAGNMVSIGASDSSRRAPLVRSMSASNLPESREQQDLEVGEDDQEHAGLDLEDPEVVENYARLQEEQAAKLEAWLGNSNEDEATPQS